MEHICRYLKDIHFNKKSGRLVFRHQDIQKYLFFQDGALIHAKTNQRKELLGEVLFKLGKISQEDHRAIDDHIKPGESLGELLIKKGIISEEDLEDGLVYQMREITLNIFPFFEGELKFQETADFSEQILETKIDVASLIEDGIRRMKFHPSLEDYLTKRVPLPKNREFFYHLTEDEKDVLRLVDGTSETQKLLEASELSSEVFWKSLFLLYCLGLIGFEEEESSTDQQKSKDEESDDIEERIKEVLSLSEGLSRMNYYQILDVSPSASREDIKKSYFMLARKYHPDLFNRELPQDLKQKIEHLFASITKAYRTLSGEAERRLYDSKMESLSPEKKKDAVKEAEIKFRKGKTLYDRGMYEDALVLLEEATRLMKEKGNYFLLLALTESKIPVYHKRAEEHFLRAIKLDPWNPEAHVGLGLLYKKSGLTVKARKRFQKALSLDPDHPLARKELGPAKKEKKTMGLKDILTMDIFGKKKK
jgi:curved DNA-binding protein CbpA